MLSTECCELAPNWNVIPRLTLIFTGDRYFYLDKVTIVVTIKSNYHNHIMEALMQSKSIGIREAKIHLSKLLRLVREGNEVILTDRGLPVGKIVPIQSETLPLSVRIQHLEDQGVLEPVVKKAWKKTPSPIPVPEGLAQKFLQEDRDNAQ
jgi:prevent-host-death family protein